MKLINSRRAHLLLGFALLAGVPAGSLLNGIGAYAQNATTGALTGVVKDSTGAVVPGASVQIRDTATGAVVNVSANAEGRYVAPLLKPSKYELTANASGLTSQPTTIDVLVGQTPNVDLSVAPTGASATVEVSAQAAQLTDTQTASLTTTLTEEQIQSLPAPGGDISTVAYTSPGVVLNSGGAYGNFSSDGLPSTSNLYVMNGFDDEDPFLNLNNSGSSNLTLGQGEVSEAAVVQNGYSAQYGRAAGAIINWTTKSGTNNWHGSADYWYNGSILNSNDWFRKQSGLGRPKAVSNQWAANVGGPILKDKLFFFADYEGLQYVLPASGYVSFPTQAFQNAVLQRVQQTGGNTGLYQQAFALYNASPNFARATPVVNGSGQLQDSTGMMGCGSAAALGIPDGTGGTFGTTSSCTAAALGTASNINKEWLFTGRIDWNVSNKQKLFGRYKMDRGSQPTYTSFVSPMFNTLSSQPGYEGQLNDTYSFSPALTNQFVIAGNWYTAYFGPTNLQATLAAFPTYFASIADGGSNGSASYGGNSTIGLSNSYINGRNVTQYQFVDDLTWTKGNHTLRFGLNFRRDDLSDYDSQQNFAGTYGLYMNDFADGALLSGNSNFQQTLTNNKTAYLALYNLGAYAQDEWQATRRLKLTMGLRFDRTGNPLCNNNCFSLYNGAFPQAGVSTATPYRQLINANQGHAFENVQSVNPQARFGFNYDVMGDGHTVIRGGFGMFTDLYPAGLLDGFIQNLPNVYKSYLTTGKIGSALYPGSAAASSAASYQAIEQGFATGASSSSLSAAVPYAPPGFVTAPNEFKNPTVLEFSLQLQRQLGRSDAIILSYVGNTGYDEIIQNGGADAYSPTGFGGLSATQADPNFAYVDAYSNAAHSNYNAGSVTWKHIDTRGLTVDATYTWSKSMDDASNEGINNEPYNYNSYYAGSNYQIDPHSVSHLNYSLSDYDIRNSLVVDYVYTMPFHFHEKYENSVLSGWMISGKSFYRAGQPFTVYNGAAAAASLKGSDIGGVLVDFVNPNMHATCGASAANPLTPCLSTSQFVPYGQQADFGNRPRNQFTGPRYADTDLALSKKVAIREGMNVQIGANAFNIANHPNFALPAANIAASGFGTISSIAAPPTSPYGSFQGAGVGGRVLQVFGKFSF